MTEAEFLTTTTRPSRMLAAARRTLPLRKFPLVAAGFCRLLPDATLEVGGLLTALEDHVRGVTPYDHFAAAYQRVYGPGDPTTAAWAVAAGPAAAGAVFAAFHRSVDGTNLALSRVLTAPDAGTPGRATRRRACEVVRCVAGNPFRPWTLLPPFLGGGVIQPDRAEVRFASAVEPLAQAIDRGRHYGRLPILADALEESGVTDEGLLTHCRSEAPHVPGCWAVELALGRG